MTTILVPIDLSDATEPVVEAGSVLARAVRAKIVLAHVIRRAVIVNEYSAVVESLAVAVENNALEQLSHWQAELQNDGFTVETRSLYGQPAACIREEAEQLEADYIVVGSHGHAALYDLVVGSTASALLKEAPCPVLIVPVANLRRPAVDSGARALALTGNAP
ncbi:MAG TPA: universal stress protein [Opitutaceae bacterium]|nr:universal stress protein [Opitutaceae bacterium]